MSDPTTMSTPQLIRSLTRDIERATDRADRAAAENATLREQLEALQNSNTVLELERNMAISRSQFWLRVMKETAYKIGIDHPETRCVICMGHLVTEPHLRAVFAGSNEDGSPRFAHRGCWKNMRDYLWSSYGVSLDQLA